ncbi:MAG TPA: DUF4253 domain-containing protein [Hyphomicrobiaceae bacterium]|nr:DUF4253 domain-containing protein [Hyphomicrobiaceae bacterium]
MHLHSAGSVVDDVVIPFAYVRVPAPAARSALEDLQRQYSAATPIIVAGKTNSLHLLFDEPPTLSPEELIERSSRGDGWSLQLAYERDLHDRRMARLKALNAPAALIWDWRPPQSIDVSAIVNEPWPEPLPQPMDLSTRAQDDPVCVILIPTVRSWEAPAYLHFGGWNACPAPWVHVAYAREWSARFGARLVALKHDLLEYEIARPISSREDALAMAAVHAYYGANISPAVSIAQHAASLLGARLWQFWWD